MAGSSRDCGAEVSFQRINASKLDVAAKWLARAGARYKAAVSSALATDPRSHLGEPSDAGLASLEAIREAIRILRVAARLRQCRFRNRSLSGAKGRSHRPFPLE